MLSHSLVRSLMILFTFRVKQQQLHRDPVVVVRIIWISMSTLVVLYTGANIFAWLSSLHQTLNGWVQNVNPYTSNPRIGKFFNLDQCGS